MLGIGLDGKNVMYLRHASSPNRAWYFQPVSLETRLEFFKQKGIARGGFHSNCRPNAGERSQRGLVALLASIFPPARS